ncbi:src kinase-associated phosphoprotein 1 isoform X1 [Polypterus senegalus]|uniref:src kinase-associated phosphoprotein 1 isoform X1 n=1 Tax=Polypterus senegalus TaxID=55291 RepID=UPI00196515CD|nr:src kinase-associated phosphoprotein 1 isoform X1 [Polypterus senegalus]
MQAAFEDFRRLIEDSEYFVAEILQDENLSKKAHETREILLRNFVVVRNRHPNEFQVKADSGSQYSGSKHEDSSDDNHSLSLAPSLPSDNVSVASDYQDDGSPEDFEEIDLVGAQELANILKQGYLEKKRRDHSFFGSEWQKRWCVLNNNIFYYYGSDKEKQQKGAFYINGYQVELVGSLRKDAKKNACFELKAPGQRTYQFTANTAKEAKEWVDQINFVLKDISSTQIPYDDGEEDMEESQISQGNEDQEEETYDDIDAAISPNTAHNSFSSQSVDGPFEDEEDNDIYEELPDEEFPLATSGEGCGNKLPSGESSVDYANYYQGMWDCTGDQSDELSFKRGDLIYILSKEYNIYGWWVGELNGNIGIVPKDFLTTAYIL